MAQFGGVPESLASVAGAEIEYWVSASEAVLTAGIADPRFEPEAIETSVRAAITAWVCAVAEASSDDGDAMLGLVASSDVAGAMLHPPSKIAGRAGTRIVVRAPLVRFCWIQRFRRDGAGAELDLEFLYAGQRWVQDADTAAVLSGERGTDEAMSAEEYWTFSESWTLALGEGRWQIRRSESGTLADALGYQYMVRPETLEEFTHRTGLAKPAGVPAVRRFLLVAHAVDADVGYGNTTSLIVSRPSPPNRDQARELVLPAVLADMRHSRGEMVFQPGFRALEARQLLD